MTVSGSSGQRRPGSSAPRSEPYDDHRPEDLSAVHVMLALSPDCFESMVVRMTQDHVLSAGPAAIPTDLELTAIRAERTAVPNLRLYNFTISLDGFAAGPHQRESKPLGDVASRLHQWMFATRSARAKQGLEGGHEGVEDDFVAGSDVGIGATIIGLPMFGPIRGPGRTSRELAGGVRALRRTLRAADPD